MAKYLLAGADVVMTASALLRHGPEHAAVLLDGLSDWMPRKGFAAVDEFRGMPRGPGRGRRGGARAGGLRQLRCGRPTSAPTAPGVRRRPRAGRYRVPPPELRRGAGGRGKVPVPFEYRAPDGGAAAAPYGPVWTNRGLQMETDRCDGHILIVGGGGTGGALAHDLSLRGLRVTLVERGEVTSGTTGRHHGMLHSGGRYAVNDRESAVECIEENMILRRICPGSFELNDGLFVAVEDEDMEYLEPLLEGCEAAGIPARRLTPGRGAGARAEPQP